MSYLFDRDEQEMYRRGIEDTRGSIEDMIKRRFKNDIGHSFDSAYAQMRQGKPLCFALKGGGVALGCLMMGDGIYHVISGVDERVDDLFLNRRNASNYTRVFAGITELGLGAVTTYVALTKGATSLAR